MNPTFDMVDLWSKDVIFVSILPMPYGFKLNRWFNKEKLTILSIWACVTKIPARICKILEINILTISYLLFFVLWIIFSFALSSPTVGRFSGNSSQQDLMRSKARPSRPLCRRTWGRKGGMHRFWMKCTISKQKWQISPFFIKSLFVPLFILIQALMLRVDDKRQKWIFIQSNYFQ